MNLNCTIESTLLMPTATIDEIDKLFIDAATFTFAGVCINPSWVPRVRFLSTCARARGDYCPRIVSVVGFPLGQGINLLEEIRNVCDLGAREIDTVIDLALIKEKRWGRVTESLREAVDAAGPYPVKVIIETPLLTDDEIRHAADCVVESGAKFVKTCTGYHGPLTRDAFLVLRQHVDKSSLGIKVSGGISLRADAEWYVSHGAVRIGTSHALVIRDLIDMVIVAPNQCPDCRKTRMKIFNWCPFCGCKLAPVE